MKIIFFIILLTISPIREISAQAKSITTKNNTKKGIGGKVKDAASYGFGWQLGKEGAKALMNKGMEIANDPKTKEKIKILKDKNKEINKKR